MLWFGDSRDMGIKLEVAEFKMLRLFNGRNGMDGIREGQLRWGGLEIN